MSIDKISRRSFVGLTTAAVASVPLLAACGSSGTGTGSSANSAATAAASATTAAGRISQLYTGAKKEGTVGWYTSALLPAAQAYAKIFEAKFPGVKVAITRDTVPNLMQRFSQEQAAGTHNCDVFGISAPGAGASYHSSGYVVPYKIFDYDLFPAASRGYTGVFELYDKFTPIGPIVFNTQKIQKADVPTSFKALFELSPETYNKKIVIYDVRVFPYVDEYAMWVSDLGHAGVKPFSRLNPVVVNGSSLVSAGITSGQYWMCPTFNMQGYLDLVASKAPVDFVIPSEGIYLQPGSHLLASGAQHPNAAALWMEYIYSAAGQVAWCAPGYVPSRPSVVVPHGLEWVATAKIQQLDLTSIFDNQTEYGQQAASDLGLSAPS